MARFSLVTVLSSSPRRFSAGVYAANLSRIKEASVETDLTTEVMYDYGGSVPMRVVVDAAKAAVDAVLDVQFPDAAFPYDVLTIDGKTVNKEITIRASTIVVAYEDPSDSSQTMMMVLPEKSTRMERWVIDMPLVTVGSGGDTGFLNLTNTDMDGTVAVAPTSAPVTAAGTTAAGTTSAGTTSAGTTSAGTTGGGQGTQAQTTSAGTTSAGTTSADGVYEYNIYSFVNGGGGDYRIILDNSEGDVRSILDHPNAVFYVTGTANSNDGFYTKTYTSYGASSQGGNATTLGIAEAPTNETNSLGTLYVYINVAPPTSAGTTPAGTTSA